MRARLLRCVQAAFLALLGALTLPLAAAAQQEDDGFATVRATDQATLVADRVYINGDALLVAEGSVEVFYRGAKLRAERLVYDRTTDRLRLEGPITLTEGDDIAILADQAELSADLSDGILTSARIVLDQQLQLAANQIARVGGRYTELSKAVASSCQVCANRPVPLWEIRARRIVHDQVGQQLYFDHAQFRIMNVPVFYFPRLRLPDPTLDRATGFMMPRIRNTTSLGPGVKLPYFITLGDSRDLTLTPYYAVSKTRTLEFRYRQAFRNGGLSFTGAVSRDDLLPDDNRAYLFGSGSFALPRDFELHFGLELVTDDAYLLDYGISQKDRLASGITLNRTRRNEHIEARLFSYHSIRAGEDDATLPTLIADFTLHRRFRPLFLGGEGGFRLQTHSQRRSSDTDVIGRDVARLSARLDWRRNWVLPHGLVLSGLGELNADFYAVGQDTNFAPTITRITPVAAVELRWPLIRTSRRGISHVIEPVIQVAWAKDRPRDVPNEDSQLVEFDEGNLFDLSRFPGEDRREGGLRTGVGLGWTRHDPGGWSLGVTAGRVLRKSDLGQFSDSSGLSGKESDWLIAAQLATAGGFSLTNRALVDDDLNFTRDELRLTWLRDRIALSTSYVWLIADAAEDRPDDTSELGLDASWEFRDGWTANVEGRYDFVADRATRAGLGMQYANECVTLDLSLSRRFTSSTSVTPTTDFDLSVRLNGFGSGAGGRSTARSCR